MKNKTRKIGLFIIPILIFIFWLLKPYLYGYFSYESGRLLHINSSILSSSVTMLGFLITSLSILVSLSGQPFIMKMKKTGHFKNLIDSIFLISTYSAVSFLLSFVLQLVEEQKNIMEPLFYFNLSVFFSAVFLIYDIGRKFWFVFSGICKTEE